MVIRETDPEDFAEQHADQWLGCTACKRSHHNTSFCRSCGRCFYTQTTKTEEGYTFVYCECGNNDLWD